MTLEAPVLNSPPAEKPKDENKSFGAENLTPEDIEKRERNVELLKQAVNRWIEENIRERNYLNKKELSQLVKFLHENHSEQMYAITDQFIDRGKYRNRPAVLFYEAGKDKYDVDIYLLGWRSPDENEDHREIDDEPEEVPSHLAQPDGTFIHDHEAAEAAIEVLN